LPWDRAFRISVYGKAAIAKHTTTHKSFPVFSGAELSSIETVLALPQPIQKSACCLPISPMGLS